MYRHGHAIQAFIILAQPLSFYFRVCLYVSYFQSVVSHFSKASFMLYNKQFTKCCFVITYMCIGGWSVKKEAEWNIQQKIDSSRVETTIYMRSVTCIYYVHAWSQLTSENIPYNWKQWNWVAKCPVADPGGGPGDPSTRVHINFVCMRTIPGRVRSGGSGHLSLISGSATVAHIINIDSLSPVWLGTRLNIIIMCQLLQHQLHVGACGEI